MLDTLSAMEKRNSIREFESQEIPLDILKKIALAAGRAPSSKNTQPWKLFLVRGQAMQAMRADFSAAFDQGMPGKADYAYSPNPLPESWSERAKACGIGIFKHKGIGRDDKDLRRQHDRANFEFFNAPHAFVLGTDRSAFSYGTFLDCGFVLNNLMLGLTALGYGSCPQFSTANYPDLLRKHIPGSDQTLMIAVLPCGVPKANSHVNLYQPERMPLEQWFTVVE